MSQLSDASPKQGAGPFLFEAPELAPGESFTVDFRTAERNGKKRGYRKYAPFDVVTVTNGTTDAPIRMEINGQYPAQVLPSTVESFDDQQTSEISITNISAAATIPEGVATIEAVKEPYDGDDAARERLDQGVVGQVVEHFTGVDLIGAMNNGR